jgi:hypothetical protein
VEARTTRSAGKTRLPGGPAASSSSLAATALGARIVAPAVPDDRR